MTSLALLPLSGSEGLHPIVLAACYDNKVRSNDSYMCKTYWYGRINQYMQTCLP